MKISMILNVALGIALVFLCYHECGITLEKFSDLKNGDIFEAYEIREIKQ